jgi:hypothetical protein
VQLNATHLDQAMLWLGAQERWAAAQVKSHPRDSYWQMLGLLSQQFEGLVEGYQARAAAQPAGSLGGVGRLAREDIVFLNSNGDLYDVLDMLDAQVGGWVGARGTCSPRLGPWTAVSCHRHVLGGMRPPLLPAAL